MKHYIVKDNRLHLTTDDGRHASVKCSMNMSLKTAAGQKALDTVNALVSMQRPRLIKPRFRERPITRKRLKLCLMK
jgi:hypothetical protein